ncbi:MULTISPECIES: hypothetical protein [unclassified Exiguobacterium]|uniref:DUF7878 domain-containing protein n=1 Tax=unclassified Exiguobacterium TaxID=2644629 RepID=UPI0008CB2910|nr:MULTISPECIES: hypothetical protein [unclassified Exiguobacterium]OGX77784.1 hypothetical protein A6395_15510 [Exiguobacterium sp. SH31]TCI59048.1 hypothetical protein EVJ21_14015 [Exiguobacterium sp. SH0S2]
MVSIPGQVTFNYDFISDSNSISNKSARNVPTILSVEADFTIEINQEVYFQAELPILEFYKSLYRWKENLSSTSTPEFHYYSVEHADYDNGAIISMIPFSDKGRIKSIWAKLDVYNVFDLDYLVKSLLDLESSLKNDIENFYGIDMNKFIKHIPFTLAPDDNEYS